MQPQDSDHFFDRLALLGELFEAKFSPAKAALYFESLRDLPLEDVLAALNAAVKVCTFMPKPAELRKLAVGDDEDLAERAWMAFRKAMQVVGAYASLVTTDGALGETIVAMFGSWAGACQTDLSSEMWASKRKEFGRVYRVLRDRPCAGARYLPGICEQQNGGRLDWLKYTTVGVLEATGDLRQVRGDQADNYRGLLAARANRLRQIADGATLPARRQGAA